MLILDINQCFFFRILKVPHWHFSTYVGGRTWQPGLAKCFTIEYSTLKYVRWRHYLILQVKIICDMDAHNVKVLVQLKSSWTQCYESEMYRKNCVTPKKNQAKNSATYAQGVGKLCYMVVHVIKTTYMILSIWAWSMSITFYFKVN
jgi:hypothetical protein